MLTLIFLIISAIAGAYLMPTWIERQLGIVLPPVRASKFIIQSCLFMALMAFFFSLKLWPFALLVLLVGAGVIMNSHMQKAMADPSLNEDERSTSAQSTTPLVGKMTSSEAYAVLGLEEGASEADVDRAYKKLMLQIHPDAGGTDYLASKINEARDVLKQTD